ncbi:MAG: hypothetical protein QNJ13_08210 [Paracoccaceae bacterium]|nr:hypothetical protein [Paracoccaceae bacterium]
MTSTSTDPAVNGRRPSGLFAALVIDADIERHLALRRTLRSTGLFATILSAESVPIARGILTDPDTPTLALILVGAEMAEGALRHMTLDRARRAVIVADEAMADAPRPVLLAPVAPADIEAVLSRLGPLV